MSTPMGTPFTAGRPVLPSILAATEPGALLLEVEAVLVLPLGAVAAKATAALIVKESCYDTAEVLAELCPAILSGIGIPPERHSRILGAVFGAELRPPPFTPVKVPLFQSQKTSNLNLSPHTIIFIDDDSIALPWDNKCHREPVKVFFVPLISPRPSHKESCAICLECTEFPGGLALELPCGHVFCWLCIGQHATHRGVYDGGVNCPLCRGTGLPRGQYYTPNTRNIDLYRVEYIHNGKPQMSPCAIGSLSLPPHISHGTSVDVEIIFTSTEGWVHPYDTLVDHQRMMETAREKMWTEFARDVSLIKRSCSQCCSVCGKRENLSRCNRCKLAVYCSASCQKIAWKRGHKAECRA